LFPFRFLSNTTPNSPPRYSRQSLGYPVVLGSSALVIREFEEYLLTFGP
jgi:hypothetical protein